MLGKILHKKSPKSTNIYHLKKKRFKDVDFLFFSFRQGLTLSPNWFGDILYVDLAALKLLDNSRLRTPKSLD